MVHPGPGEASSGSDLGSKCGSGGVAEQVGCENMTLAVSLRFYLMAFSSWVGTALPASVLKV